MFTIFRYFIPIYFFLILTGYVYAGTECEVSSSPSQYSSFTSYQQEPDNIIGTEGDIINEIIIHLRNCQKYWSESKKGVVKRPPQHEWKRYVYKTKGFNIIGGEKLYTPASEIVIRALDDNARPYVLNHNIPDDHTTKDTNFDISIKNIQLSSDNTECEDGLCDLVFVIPRVSPTLARDTELKFKFWKKGAESKTCLVTPKGVSPNPIPAKKNQDITVGVDFSKGCFNDKNTEKHFTLLIFTYIHGRSVGRIGSNVILETFIPDDPRQFIWNGTITKLPSIVSGQKS